MVDASWCVQTARESVDSELPHNIVVVEFTTIEAARHWYESSEYTELKPIRIKAARTRAFFVEGVAPS